MASPTVREATREDIDRFYAMDEKPTMRAWVVELDGEIVGFCGLARAKGRWVAFSDMKDALRPFKKVILKTGLLMMREAKRAGIRYVYSEPNPEEPNAKRFLRALGFDIDPRSPALFRWRAGE